MAGTRDPGRALWVLLSSLRAIGSHQRILHGGESVCVLGEG